MNPEQLKKALDAIEAGDSEAGLEILKAMIASAAAGGAPPAPEAEAAAEVPEAPPEEETAAAVAASRELMRVTAAKTPGEAVALMAAALGRVAALDADRSALELSERQALVTSLITAGAETPATAWEGDAEKRQPKKRLMDEPIAELRGRVKIIAASRPAGYRPPVVDDAAPTLSRVEIAACKRLGITEADYIERKTSAVRRHK